MAPSQRDLAVLRAIITGDSSGLRNELKKSDDLLKTFKNTLRTLGIAYGFKEIAQGAAELAQAGAIFMRLETSYRDLTNQAGTSADEILASMRRASSGTIDDATLMLNANRLMMFGLSTTAQEMGDLMEVARYRGRAMGLDTAKAFNDIVTGIGRMSPLILDNIGIVIDAKHRYEEYASSIGKTSVELTAAERRQIIMNSVISQGKEMIAASGGIVDDYADNFEKLNAHLTNTKNYLGTLAAKSWVIEIAVKGTEKLEEAAKAEADFQSAQADTSIWASDQLRNAQLKTGLQLKTQQDLNNALAAAWESYRNGSLTVGEYYRTVADLNNIYLKTQQTMKDDAIATQQATILKGDFTATILRSSDATAHATETLYTYSELQDIAAQRWQGLGLEIEKTQAKTEAMVLAQRKLLQTFEGSDSALNHYEHSIEGVRAAVQKYADQISVAHMYSGWGPSQTDYSTAAQFAPGKAAELRKEYYQLLGEAQKRFDQQQIDGWKEYVSQGKEAYSTVVGYIHDAMKQTPEDWIRQALVGTSAQLGEAWDEMARRAEDVGNLGKDSPWYSLFKIPEDVLQQGGDVLKAFMAQVAADIRESPSVQELGEVGVNALVERAKKTIADALAEKQLEALVAQRLMLDPEVAKNLQALGIDVHAALATGQDKVIAQLDIMKTNPYIVGNWPTILTDTTFNDVGVGIASMSKTLAAIASGTQKVNVQNWPEYAQYQGGGVVGGMTGQPRLVVAHGGEVIGQGPNYNLTIISQAKAESVEQSFHLMRSLAGGRL